jgi:hypothetical protein
MFVLKSYYYYVLGAAVLGTATLGKSYELWTDYFHFLDTYEEM